MYFIDYDKQNELRHYGVKGMKWDPSKRKKRGKKNNLMKADIVDDVYDLLFDPKNHGVYGQTFKMHGWDKIIKKKAREGIKAVKSFGSYAVGEFKTYRKKQAETDKRISSEFNRLLNGK